MPTSKALFALVTTGLLLSTGIASAQGPGASGAAATIPESDVRPSMNNAPATTNRMTEPSTTVGQSRDATRNGTMATPREGMTNGSMAPGTSNPQNSTSR